MIIKKDGEIVLNVVDKLQENIKIYEEKNQNQKQNEKQKKQSLSPSLSLSLSLNQNLSQSHPVKKIIQI